MLQLLPAVKERWTNARSKNTASNSLYLFGSNLFLPFTHPENPPLFVTHFLTWGQLSLAVNPPTLLPHCPPKQFFAIKVFSIITFLFLLLPFLVSSLLPVCYEVRLDTARSLPSVFSLDLFPNQNKLNPYFPVPFLFPLLWYGPTS